MNYKHESSVRFLYSVDNEKHSNSIKHTVVDSIMYNDSLDDIDNVKDVIYNNIDKNDFLETFTEDVFHSLYKTHPEMYDKNNLYKENHLSHDLLSEVVKGKSFKSLKVNTTNNLFNSILSLGAIQNYVVDKLNEMQQNDENLNEAINNIQEASSLREKLQNENLPQDVKESLENDLNKCLDNIDKNSIDESVIRGIVDSMEGALKEAEKMIDNVDGLLAGFGGDDSTKVQRLSIQDRIDLVSIFNNNYQFKNVCNELGRLSEMVTKAGKKPSKFGLSVCDISNGNNINRVLMSEKTKLDDKSLENEFLYKYSNKALLEYKTEGQEDGRGPVIVCLDKSGSMNGREMTWGIAVALACVQIATKQNRNCRVIPFDHMVFDKYIVDFTKKIEPSKISKIASIQAEGGTDFEEPLKFSMESLKDKRYKKADILFITDGDPSCDISKELLNKINKEKEASGLQIQSILIGRYCKDSYVGVFADKIIRILDIKDDKAMMDIFDNIQNR